ncbi:MAG: hypothetical protein LUD52_04050 [Opitutae bacterium]|nr:hypothetical protein [Opitutae bacterium]
MGFFSKIFAKIFSRRAATKLGKNCIVGELISCGACEFLATTPLGEIHGTWHGDDDCPAGTQIKIFLSPKIFKIDEFPPEENFFKFADAVKVLTIDAAKEFSGEPDDAFVWFFPEDAHGYEI